MNDRNSEPTGSNQSPNETTVWSFSIIVGVLAFIAILIFFVTVSFINTKSTLSASSALAPSLLGAFINPPKGDQQALQRAWYALVLLAFAAAVACAVGFFWSSHMAAGGAAIGAAAGVATVLTDTSTLAKPLSSLAASAKTLANRSRQ